MADNLTAHRARPALCVPLRGAEGGATRCLCFPLLREKRFEGLKRDPAYNLRLPAYGFFDTDQKPLITGVASWSTRDGDTWFEWTGSNPGQPSRLNPARLFTRGQRFRARQRAVPAFLMLIAWIAVTVLFYARMLPVHPEQAPTWAFMVVWSVMAGVVWVAGRASMVHSHLSRAIWAQLPALPPAIAALVRKYRPSYSKIYIVAELQGRWMVTETRTANQTKPINREAVVAEERQRNRRLAPIESDPIELPGRTLRAMLVGASVDPDFGTERLCLIRKFEF